jgi:hypothetical protein
VKPTPFPEANLTFRRPASMTDEECGSLEAHDTGEAFISRWEPTPEERAVIAAGGPVWIWVIGRAHPPISVQTENPFAPAGVDA